MRPEFWNPPPRKQDARRRLGLLTHVPTGDYHDFKDTGDYHDLKDYRQSRCTQWLLRCDASLGLLDSWAL